MTKLETTSHISVITLCLVAAAALVDQRVSARIRPAARDVSSLIGTHLNVPEIKWGDNPITVVVAMTTHCPYCVESVPFYRRLSASANGSSLKVALVFASSETQGRVSAFLEREGILSNQVVSVPFPQIAVSGTPTLFIVDNRGIVKKAFSGRLDGDREAQVIDMVVPRGRHS